MSVCVRIRTGKEITPDRIFDELVHQGEKIMVTEDEYPNLKFGNFYESTRGIEVNKEDNGLEVRICIFSSKADYHLFAKTIKAIMDISGDRAYLEDEDDDEITDPIKMFDDKWIAQEMKSGFETCKSLVNEYGSTVIMDGLFLKMCIGPLLFWDFNVPPTGSTHPLYVNDVIEHLAFIQWEFYNKTGTQTSMKIQSKDGAESKSISYIYVKDGKVSEFDYISFAQLVGIVDFDKDDSVLFPIEYLWKVVDPDKFIRIDNCQFKREEELTAEDVRDMIDRAKCFVPDDLFFVPTFPGEGDNDVQRTFILTWNPVTSSLTTRENNDCIKTMLISPARYWEVRDYEQVRIGDKFYVVKCGTSNTGIFQCGLIDSNPYPRVEDDGRTHYYVDLKTSVHINFNEVKILSTKELASAIPSVHWKDETSGRLLTSEEASILESMWAQYLSDHDKDVDKVKKMNRIKGNN